MDEKNFFGYHNTIFPGTEFSSKIDHFHEREQIKNNSLWNFTCWHSILLLLCIVQSVHFILTIQWASLTCLYYYQILPTVAFVKQLLLDFCMKILYIICYVAYSLTNIYINVSIYLKHLNANDKSLQARSKDKYNHRTRRYKTPNTTKKYAIEFTRRFW